MGETLGASLVWDTALGVQQKRLLHHQWGIFESLLLWIGSFVTEGWHLAEACGRRCGRFAGAGRWLGGIKPLRRCRWLVLEEGLIFPDSG